MNLDRPFRSEPCVRPEPSLLADIARSLPVFSGLPEQACIDLVQGGELFEFAEEQLIVRQAEQSDCAYVLLNGTVEVFVESKYGSVSLASFQAPALVGEVGVFMNVPRTASVRAKTKVQAVKLGTDALQHFGQQNPRFLSNLMLQLGRRFETFNKAIGFYSHALGALERDDFDTALLEDLKNPLPELVDFSRSFVRLAEQIILKRAHREEMASATAIQVSMLPVDEALVPCKEYVDVQAMMRPAREVGGDFYDFFLIDPDRLAVTIGDVCGKGIPAALFMAMTQMVMRYMLRQESDVGAAATAGNALLAASNREMMFATMFCCVIHLRTGDVSYTICGHHSPLILRKGQPISTIPVSSLPLGIDENARYKTSSLILDAGEQLFLFTDGFMDACNSEDDRFGDERLHAAVEELRVHQADQFVPALMKSIDDFAGGEPQFDDLTAVLITALGRRPHVKFAETAAERIEQTHDG